MEANKLYVDSREPQSTFNLLKKLNIDYERTTLEVGDFVFNDWVFERKTCPDLYNSIISKRIFMQVENMCLNYPNVILMISGSYKSCIYVCHTFNINIILGYYSSLVVNNDKIKMIHVDNDTELIKTIKMICDKSINKTEKREITNIIKIRDEDTHVMMLSCIDKVGIEKARKILSVYPFNKLCDVSAEDLKKIEGIGDVIANNIKNKIFK